MAENKVFHLDSVEMLWAEFRMRHAREAEDTRWMKEFKATIKQVAADAEEFHLRNVKVAMFVPGALNRSLLADEQPDLVKQYTRHVVKEEFDEEAFAKDHPDLFTQYRSKGFKLSTGAPSLEF